MFVNYTHTHTHKYCKRMEYQKSFSAHKTETKYRSRKKKKRQKKFCSLLKKGKFSELKNNTVVGTAGRIWDLKLLLLVEGEGSSLIP